MKHTKTMTHDSDVATEARKATDLLRSDHEKVRGLFGEFRKAEDDASEKKRLHEEIDREVSIHAKVEEEIFYPAVRGAEAEESEKLVLEAREEHALVKGLLADLRGMSPDDESFDAKMKVVMDLVEHHAEEEEKEMFEAAEELGDDELLQLGERIAGRKPELEAEFESKGQLAESARRGSVKPARATDKARSSSRSANGGKQRKNGSRRR